ncbi:MAG: hypothetical protein AB1656_22440 [Candidatus Omnitrophota bacterium]
MKPFFRDAMGALFEKKIELYKQSKKEAASYFKDNPIKTPYPVVMDDDAKALMDTVLDVENEWIAVNPQGEETYRRIGRHIREYLADYLLKAHQHFLDEILLSDGKKANDVLEYLGVKEHFPNAESHKRFNSKLLIYKKLGAFVHPPELSLSMVKVSNRAGARAQRGNLWPSDRREKYEFLENLSDAGKVCPPFTEIDLEFLVSQSSMEMLKNKTELLLNELRYVEPNRLKANYSRLKDHLQRSKQRQSDYERRRELLMKLGASPQQVDYISARATFQTMKNLLKLANGKLAISDLMGGKRTIRKLLRKSGRAQSKAESAICNYLVKSEGVTRAAAESYARTRKNHSLKHLQQTVEFLKDNYRRLYRAHWGFNIRPNVLRRALELGLSRQKLSKRAITKRDFLNDLRRALALEEALVIKEQDRLTPDARRQALAPLKEVLDYETDTDTRKQLYFIYEQFCRLGLCIPKDKLKQLCLRNSTLFPSPRKVQDALEILNGAYRAIGQHGETVCVLPDYLHIANRESNMR